MKIYNELRVNIETGEVLHEDSFEYTGEVAMCGGGGTQLNSQDTVFNAGLLDIYKSQDVKATELWNQFKFGNTQGIDYNEQVKGYIDDTGKFIETGTGAGKQATDDLLNKTNPLTGKKYTEAEAQELSTWMGTSGEVKAIPEGYQEVTKTRGEIMGIDPNFTTELEYTQKVIDENAKMLPLQSQNQAAQLNLSNEELAEASRILKLGKESGLPEATINSQLAQLGLSTEQAASAKRLIPLQESEASAQLGLSTEQANSAKRLLPLQERATSTGLQDTITGINERAPVRSKMFKTALDGVDGDKAANEAQAGVEQGFKLSGDTYRRQLSSYGLNPGDNTSYLKDTAFSKAREIAGARTKAKNDAKTQSFDMLSRAMGAV